MSNERQNMEFWKSLEWEDARLLVGSALNEIPSALKNIDNKIEKNFSELKGTLKEYREETKREVEKLHNRINIVETDVNKLQRHDAADDGIKKKTSETRALILAVISLLLSLGILITEAVIK